MTEEQWRSRLVVLAAIVAVVWLTQQLVPVLQSVGDILLIFFLAWIVAFILAPIVDFLERRRVACSLAVGVVYVAVVLGVVIAGVILVPIVVDQLKQMPEILGVVASKVPTVDDMRKVMAHFGVPESALAEFYRPTLLTEQINAALGSGVQGALALATSALTLVANMLLVTILSFYMLLDARQVTMRLLRLVPKHHRSSVIRFLSQWSASFGGFMRGQVIQAVLFGAVVVVVALVFRLGFVIVTALSSAVLMLLPIVGPLLALIPPVAVALFDPTAPAGSILVLLVIVQAIIVNALMPRILSGQIGVHPLLVLFAILVGLRIGGLLGSFFAVPIVGVIHGTATVLIKSWQAGEDGLAPSGG